MSAIFQTVIMNLNILHLYMNILCMKVLYAQWTVSDHNNSQWALFFSVERMLANKANLKASLNYMSAIFHNFITNLNMLHLHVNLQYLYKWICLHDGHWVKTITHIEHFVLSSAGSIKQSKCNQFIKYMSAFFHNMNLNMLHLYMNFQYLYEQF